MPDKLTANVWVGGVLYRKGSTLPSGVAEKVTNPKAWANTGAGPTNTGSAAAPALEEPAAGPAVKEPPRGGPGSSASAWRTFLESHGFEVPADATAKDMQAAWDHRDKSED